MSFSSLSLILCTILLALATNGCEAVPQALPFPLPNGVPSGNVYSITTHPLNSNLIFFAVGSQAWMYNASQPSPTATMILDCTTLGGSYNPCSKLSYLAASSTGQVVFAFGSNRDQVQIFQNAFTFQSSEMPGAGYLQQNETTGAWVPYQILTNMPALPLSSIWFDDTTQTVWAFNSNPGLPYVYLATWSLPNGAIALSSSVIAGQAYVQFTTDSSNNLYAVDTSGSLFKTSRSNVQLVAQFMRRTQISAISSFSVTYSPLLNLLFLSTFQSVLIVDPVTLVIKQSLSDGFTIYGHILASSTYPSVLVFDFLEGSTAPIGVSKLFRIDYFSTQATFGPNVPVNLPVGQTFTEQPWSPNPIFACSAGTVTNPLVYSINPSNCSLDITCSDCLSEPQYCEFCLGTETCSSISSNCTTISACPSLFSVTPPYATDDFRQSLTISGSNFITFPANHSCQFNSGSYSVNIPATVSSDGSSLQCQSPMQWTSGTNANITVAWNDVEFGTIGTLPFKFFNCSTLTSSTCGVDNQCLWCLIDHSCIDPSATTSCTAYLSQYPSIVSVNQSTAAPIANIDTIGASLNLNLSGTSSQFTISCIWTIGSSSVSTLGTSSSQNPSLVSCPSPSITWSNLRSISQNSIEAISNLSLSISTSGAIVTTSGFPITFYNCSAATTYTGSCLDTLRHPFCRWCPVESVCTWDASTGSTPSCSDPSTYNPLCSSASCSVLQPTSFSGTQSSLYIQNFSINATNTISTNGSVASLVASGAVCAVWPLPAGSAPIPGQPNSSLWASSISVTPTSTGQASTSSGASVSCNFVPPPLGDYALALYSPSMSAPVSNPVRVESYQCQATSSCTTCTSFGRSQCGWCPATSTCQLVTDSCASTIITSSNSTQCPAIIASPPAVGLTMAGDDVGANGWSMALTIQGASFYSSSNAITCNLTLGSYSYSSVTLVQGSKITCGNFPALTIAGTYNLFLGVGSSSFWTEPVSLVVTDCASIAAQFCTSCIAVPGCAWCPNSNGKVQCWSIEECAASTTPMTASTTASCSFVASPSAAETTSPFPQTALISGGPFNAQFTYSVFFGSVSVVASFIDANTLSSVVPIQRVGSITQAGLHVATINNSPLFLGYFPFSYYSCGTQFNTSTCGTSFCTPYQPFCGWCATQLSCTGPTQCSGTNDIWLANCITGSTPQNWKDSSSNLESVVNITFSTPLPASVTSSSSKKRVSSSSNSLVCRYYGSGITGTPGATVTPNVDPSGTFVTCPIPPQPSNPTASSISIGLLTPASIYEELVNPIPFFFTTCSSYSDCTSCSQQTDCGWCLGENRCSSKDFDTCSSLQTDGSGYAANDCPVINSVSPTSGKSGTVVTVEGKNFWNNIQVHIGSKTVSVKYLSNSTISFVAPSNSVGATKITLASNGQQYSINSVPFTYNGLTNGAIAGIVIGSVLGFVFIVLTIVLLAIRVVRGGDPGAYSRVEPTPPDYPVVAFGSFIDAKYKAGKDHMGALDDLEELLKVKGYPIQVCLEAAVASSDFDELGKCYIFLASLGDYAVDLMTTMVVTEVQKCQAENTIFRNNSLASKMFASWGRIVGIDYLWHSLARLVTELNVISAAEAGEENSMLTVNVEVDFNNDEYNGPVDAVTNALQLSLVCQKMFVSLSKNLKRLPKSFKDIFVLIHKEVMAKFGTEDAVVKAISGFFFLRFVCPSLTVPHAYGLLPAPPNPSCQRQLVLISKVIQSLANFALPGAKEEFMEPMTPWVKDHFDEMKKFLTGLYADSTHTAEDHPTPTTNIVRVNSLAALWNRLKLDSIYTKLKNQLKGRNDSEDIMGRLQTVLDSQAEGVPKAKSSKSDA